MLNDNQVFRQSFKDKKESKSGSQHISITPKSAIAIVPPKLVGAFTIALLATDPLLGNQSALRL